MIGRRPDGTNPPGGPTRQPGEWLANPQNATQAELAEALKEAAHKDADEVALRRVWSRLAQIQDLVPARVELEAPRRVRWPFIAAASLAGAATAVAFMLLSAAPTTPSPVAMRAAEPSASLARRADQGRSALVAPATVRTGDGETLQLALRGGADVTVTSNSALVLDANERPTVSKGEVVFHVAPQPAGQTFAVRASRYRVVVVGTRFHVRVNGSDAAVAVDEGIVEVWDADTRLARLRAGDSWASPPTPASSAESAEATSLQAASASKASPAVSAAFAAVKRGLGGARASRISHGLRASYTPGGTPAGSGASLLAPASGTTPAATSAPSVERALAAPERTTVGAEPAVVASPPVAPAASPSDVVSLVTQARAARVAGEVRKALGLYRTLAQRGGAAGENAEYEIGRILRDGLHQPREAVVAWRSYRSAHPRGLLRAETDISIIETLVAISDKGGALGEALDFVHRFPDSERRVEIGGLAGDLYRERGDFHGAVAEYDRALESARGHRESSDAISFHRSICLLHEDRDGGISALRSYLQSFPAGRFRFQAERLLEDHAKASTSRSL